MPYRVGLRNGLRNGHLDAIRGALVGLLEAINEAEQDNAFGEKSVEKIFAGLVKGSATQYYEWVIALIRVSPPDADAKTSFEPASS